MPDISMCNNRTCPSRKKCYRYMAISSNWQSFGCFEVPKGKVRCDDFLEIWPTSRISDRESTP